jgi:capsule polysaccharide export protein KpsC/LpsZ
MALTLRTPHLLDQLALIDYLCRSVPDPHLVVIKEHPAMVGAVDSGRVKVLLKKYDNLRILPPGTNNYEVIAQAQAVISINSKSGAEAALLGKRVLVLGDAFYKNSSLVTYIERIENLSKELEILLNNPSRNSADQKISNYFAAVWRSSLPGELYVSDDQNIEVFVNSLYEI